MHVYVCDKALAVFSFWKTAHFLFKADECSVKHLKLSSQIEESLNLQENKLKFFNVPVLLWYSRDMCAWAVP